MDLIEFVNSSIVTKNGYRNGNYYVITKELPSHDFNKEIIAPGLLKQWPEGVLGIRVDDNFWAVAALPYEFKNISIKNIVKTLWPNILNPRLNPDYIETVKNIKLADMFSTRLKKK